MIVAHFLNLLPHLILFPLKAPDGSQFFLYGSPIGNSPSPILHNTAFENLGINNKYQLFDTKDFKQVVISLRNKKTGGGSVTMPHKQTVMPFLDEISESARAIGRDQSDYD